MSFNSLYQTSVIKNIIDWNVSTEPTDDSYLVQEKSNTDFNEALKKFTQENPEHPVSVYNKDLIFSPELELKKTQVSQKLWKKYLSMKQDKLPVDEEYFKIFDKMVSVTKEMLIEKDLRPIDLMVFNDSKLGKPEFILSVVEKMASISKDFIKEKPKNSTAAIKDFSMEELIQYVEYFKDIEYKISNKNGSFMTPLDKDNSRIHIAKNKKDLFDSASSVTHEVGHALYQNRVLNKNTEIGKIGQCVSLSLHESSSIIHEIALSGINFDVKDSSNNLYRLGTDKVHYIIHIYIRMKIESMLFNDEIKAKDIPHIWNSFVTEYIGITPQDDWEGFLQDVHWNSGAFGYFQSYAIGFFNAVHMYQAIKENLTDDMTFNTEEIILKKINDWYGHYNEYSEDILIDMHPDIEKTLKHYKDFIFNNFNYCL